MRTTAKYNSDLDEFRKNGSGVMQFQTIIISDHIQFGPLKCWNIVNSPVICQFGLPQNIIWTLTYLEKNGFGPCVISGHYNFVPDPIFLKQYIKGYRNSDQNNCAGEEITGSVVD